MVKERLASSTRSEPIPVDVGVPYDGHEVSAFGHTYAAQAVTS
jgi:hypothetical protein